MQLRAPRIPRPLSRSAFRCTGASQFPTMEKTPLESSRRALLVSPVAYKSLGYRFSLLLGGAQAPSMQFNAENKRRPDRAVRWRPKAGTNLIDLLSGWTFTTQSIARHGAQFTWSREGFFERESLGGRAMLSQGVQLLRRFFD